MIDQHYRSSERGKAVFFQHDLVAQLGSEQDWSAS